MGKEKKMPAPMYATPYGMQSMGSQGLNRPAAGGMAPPSATPQMPGGSPVPPPAVPPAPVAPQGNAMNEQLAAFFTQLRQGMGGGGSGGNPLLEAISARGAALGEGPSFGDRFGVR